MIYFLLGNDFTKRKNELEKIVANTEGVFDKVYIGDFSLAEFESLFISKNLFVKKNNFIIYEVLSDEVYMQVLTKYWKAMEGEKTVYVFVENKYDKRSKKKYLDYGRVIDCNSVKEKRDNSIFVLTDAFLVRDKKKAWLTFQSLLNNNTELMSILNTLNWQIKNMILVEKSQGNPGLSPFVFSKIKMAEKKFSLGQLLRLHEDLILIAHNERSEDDLGVALEKFLLSI